MSLSKIFAAFTASAAVEPTKSSLLSTKTSKASPQPTASIYKISPTTQITDNNIVITPNGECSLKRSTAILRSKNQRHNSVQSSPLPRRQNHVEEQQPPPNLHIQTTAAKLNRLRKTQSSNSMLFKNPLRRNLSSTSIPVATNTIITSPPSPDATVPLWTEQVDAETKKKMDPETIQRQEVMFEIIRTEKEFVDDLQYLLDHYVTAIQGSRIGIRLPNSLVQTFSVLQEIYYMHRNISRQLLNLQAIYQVVPSITEALNSLVVSIRIYDKYLLYHKAAISELANARKKGNKLGQLVNKLESHVTTGRYRSLESLLTKPIQRLCKYPLLIMTLLRVTPEFSMELPIRIDHEQLSKLHNKLDCEIRELQERNERAKREENLNRRINKINSLALMVTRQNRRLSIMASTR